MLIGKQTYIISGGRDINIEINREEIEMQIMKKYEDALKNAGFLSKIKIYMMIKSEIRKKIEEVAPSKGLYFKEQKKQ